MLLTGENLSIWIGSTTNATVFTTNLTWTDLRSNTGLLGERPATDSLRYDAGRTVSFNKTCQSVSIQILHNERQDQSMVIT
jgi:hypothetical protein